MIKLIASDLDGSLLDDDKNLPADFDRVLAGLKEKDVTFVVASGRDFASTEAVFGDRVNRLMCICNNGANIYENGKMIICHSLTKQQVKTTLDLVRSMENTEPLVFTLNKTYYTDGCEGFMEWARNPYSPMDWVASYDELYNIEGDIFKIAIYDGSGNITDYSYPAVKAAVGGETAVYVSGDIWVDVVNTNASKGMALQLVQEKLGISKENTMAFGDYYNDETLLERAEYAFVMEKGVDLLKEKFPLRSGDNNRGGVTATIKEWVLKK